MRGSLDAAEAAAALAAGVRAAGATPVEHPLADGGEGSLATVQAARGGAVLDVDTFDALGRPLRSRIGTLGDGTALVEAAESIGWDPLHTGGHDVMRASGAGLAAPVLAAVRQRSREIVVFLGGTATMDGGLGPLASLGADIRDADGRLLDGGATDLARVRSIDLTPVRGRLAGHRLLIATADLTRTAYAVCRHTALRHERREGPWRSVLRGGGVGGYAPPAWSDGSPHPRPPAPRRCASPVRFDSARTARVRDGLSFPERHFRRYPCPRRTAPTSSAHRAGST
ncbi:glycerate kinase [Streptomyces sp. NPDC093089]|uniref:glycerate kinase n=1 Tax=Streptomyces sp. NPDC093089 TaxID=3366024 RepID=UPI00381F8944